MPPLPHIVLSRPTLDRAGLEALGVRWRELETAADSSPFQAWTWVGCNAAERFPDPLLIEAADAQGPLAIALCNRRRSWFRGDSLYLHESSDPAADAVFTEHNDPLIARRAPAGMAAALLRTALTPRDGRAPRLVLSGVGDATRAAALDTGAVVMPGQDRAAPFVDLTAVGSGGYEGQLSRNTRQQLRRSDRAYAAAGPLRLDRAKTVDEALAFLDALIGLHAATWRSRGRPGAFSTAPVRRFHDEFVRRGAPDAVELLRVTAGDRVVGYLYNLVQGGWACAYQSGFDYPGAPAHGKPGLTCHHLAIAAHAVRGGRVYDFLGGADRYKRSLANAERTLHWLAVAPALHPAALLARLRGRIIR